MNEILIIPYLLTVFGVVLGVFATLFFFVERVKTTPSERWWHCDSCGCYHNEAGERTDLNPIELRGSLTCSHCANDMRGGSK